MSICDDMLIVGITGRSGSGKSTVARHYANLGHAVCDGDALTKEIYLPGSECLKKLVNAFGSDILNVDGTLNRKELGRRAFADVENNRILIRITHPYIVKEVTNRAKQAHKDGAQLFFLDGAMIVGGPAEEICDELIVVVTEGEKALERIELRDKIEYEEVRRRLEVQPTDEVLIAKADDIIENNGDMAELLKRADEVLDKLITNRR